MAAAQRDPWLDNTKMVLVTLVVIGHAWGLLPDTHASNWAYDFLYFWHIPAFVFLSGYLSKSFEWTRRHFKGLLYVLVLPYLVFEPALYYYRVSLGETEPGMLYLQPHWTMWYLIVLFFWRLMTPILKRHWLFLPGSVVVSLVAGLLTLDWFMLPRILGLLPFFVLGLHLKPRHLRRLDDPWVKVSAVGALLLIGLVSSQTDEWARTAFLWYDAGYEDLDLQVATAVQTRLSIIAVGLIGAFSVMALVPRRAGWFTAMGAATMNVYLLHGFVIKTVRANGFAEWSVDHPTLALVLTTLGSIALALVLASPWSRRYLSWVVNPLGTWESRRTSARRREDRSPQVPTTDGRPSAEPSPAPLPRAGSAPIPPGGPDTTAPTPPPAADGAAGPGFPLAAPSTERRGPESTV
ncbi:acyltransferase family protein [Nocardioides piscis]|uniref:Acyltransferase family protein n=1 Tax=Nocardioides piscis TaxID=2714938 RepID=A0A6G7YBZ2_9ACTN|nr:acyltransferase family protein [Nocardioides piscis]QIK74424.1 acyltransferase family protein [Nocardioides piscis]